VAPKPPVERLRIVGVYEYCCRLVPGRFFPTENTSDGLACNMHGGTATIMEVRKDNGAIVYCVSAQREWKARMERDDERHRAPDHAEMLETPLVWTSPALLTTRVGVKELDDQYFYEYKVPILSSHMSESHVQIVGDCSLQVVDAPGNEVREFQGRFKYRQENVTSGIGESIFLSKIASQWTDLEGTVRLHRKDGNP